MDSSECQWESSKPFILPVDLGMPRYTPISPVPALPATHLSAIPVQDGASDNIPIKYPFVMSVQKKKKKKKHKKNKHQAFSIAEEMIQQKLPKFRGQATYLESFLSTKTK